MTAAAGGVRTGLITLAARDSTFDGQEIREGEYLALLEDALAASGGDIAAVTDAVAASLAEGTPEFVTVFTGAQAAPQETETVTARLAAALGDAELTVVFGGQPVYRYMISAE
jgi:dihydroxyacetone kinase-like predicted kinase